MKAKLTACYRGYTLVEIMLIVTIMGMLGVITVCNYIIARDTSRLAAIRSNLKEIEAAKKQWAFENMKSVGDEVADVRQLTKYLRQGAVVAVISETYNPNPVGIAPSAALPDDVKLGPYGPGATIPAP